MKKLMIFASACIAIMMSVTSCIKDEGNYVYSELPEFYVDTTGVSTDITVTQFETFSVPSRLKYAGDASNLIHQWTIYGNGASHAEDNIAEVLSSEKDFTGALSQKPGKYSLQYTATDKVTGVRASMRYNVTLQGMLGSGMLVLYDDGNKPEIDIIRSQYLNSSLANNSIGRKMYTTANSNTISGTPKQIAVTSDYVYLYTNSNACRLSTTDLVQTESYEKMFWTAPANPKPDMYADLNGSSCVIDNGQAYFLISGWDNGNHFFPDARVVSGGSYYATGATYTYGVNLLIFDKLSGKFMISGMWEATFIPISDPALTPIVDMDLTSMGVSYTPISGAFYCYSFFKGKNDSAERVCKVLKVSSASGSTLVASLDMSSCPEASVMKCENVSKLSPLMYYAGKNSIYVASFNLDEKIVNAPAFAGWTCPDGEEITYMTLTNNYSTVAVATWNGTEGKVYLLNTAIDTGLIDSTPVEIYTGFGKINGMAYK